MEEAPERIDQLEQRLTELESKLQRAPGEACPSCGALEFRVKSSTPNDTFGDLGGVDRLMRCADCGYEETQLHTPGRG